MEISLPVVTSRDFPMRLSRVFRYPGHCVHYDLGWWRFPIHWVYYPLGVCQREVDLHLLIQRPCYPNLQEAESDVLLSYFSPCCFERGVEWF